MSFGNYRTPPSDARMEFNELLISKVKKFTMIWDVRHRDHKNGRRLALVWGRIAKELNSTVKVVMSRWRNLRDTYRKHLKKVTASNDVTAVGESDESLCRWVHFEQLHFLTTSLTTTQPDAGESISDLDPIITVETVEEVNDSNECLCEDEQLEVPPITHSLSEPIVVSQIPDASEEPQVPAQITSKPSVSSHENRQPAKKRRHADQASQRFLEKIDRQLHKNVQSTDALDSLLVGCMQRESDHIESFLLSLAPQMRDTPRELLPSLKMHLLYIITKYGKGIVPSKLVSLDL